jgi:hypothetical protein
VFVSGKPFQTGLRFVRKAGAYPSPAPKRNSQFRVDSWFYQQTSDKAGKACQRQTLPLIMKICKLQT